MRAELSTLLTRFVRDPGIASVTITRVSMTTDLQFARVFYTLAGDSDRREAAKAFRRARSFLRRELGQRLQLRKVPEFRFMYDDSAEQQDRIAHIFEEIENARTNAEPEQSCNSGDVGSGEPRGT